MKEKLYKIWKDPVGSNVMAFLIITLLIYLTEVLIKIVKGLYNKIPIPDILQGIREVLTLKTEIPIWIVILFIGICLTTIYQIARKLYHEYNRDNKSAETENLDEELPLFRYSNGLDLFENRVAYAFPGLRDKVEWYKGKDAVKRLSRLLCKPLVFLAPDKESQIKPIWWYRAGSSMFIENFEEFSGAKCLMNHDELIIDKIAVFHSQFDFQNFVYVETSADKPTGVYKYPSGYIEERRREDGYYSEEFGLLNNKAIKREEYDDGAATINGKVIDTHGAKLRTRNLTKYNFLITSTHSPYNSRKFDRDSGEIMNGILKGEKEFQDLLDFLMTFERNGKFYN